LAEHNGSANSSEPKILPNFPHTFATEFMLPNTRAVMLEVSDFMLKYAEKTYKVALFENCHYKLYQHNPVVDNQKDYSRKRIFILNQK